MKNPFPPLGLTIFLVSSSHVWLVTTTTMDNTALAHLHHSEMCCSPVLHRQVFTLMPSGNNNQMIIAIPVTYWHLLRDRHCCLLSKCSLHPLALERGTVFIFLGEGIES